MLKRLLLMGLVLLAGLGRPAGAQHLVAGNHHTLSIHADGTLWAWGLNGNGQVGIGSTASYPATPMAIGTANTWASLATGSFHSLGLRTNGTLWVWGSNSSGQLGLGTFTDQPSPVQLGTDTWLSVAGGGTHTLAVRADGTLWAWGYNGNGQLGTNATNQSVPTQVGAATTWKSVGAGYNSSYAIRQDGTLWAWGSNTYGELGLSSVATGTNQLTPAQVGTATWTSVDGGYYHALAVKTDGTLWAWGYNYYGQLGLGSTTNQTTPTQVGTATTWKSVSAGGYHSAALRLDNSLWGWGDNLYAQVGLPSTANQLVPAQVGTGSAWQEVSAGYAHTVALRQDGTAWAWGQTGLAELGNGVGLLTTPTAQAPAAQSWLNTSAGDYHSVAVRQDGTLWAWGLNSSGQLGLGSSTSQIAPSQVGTATTWKRVVAGTQCTAALRQDGTLWVWGANTSGQLGLGQAVSYQPVPTQLGTSTWQGMAAGSSFMLAVRADGTLWAWGLNNFGQLGQGNTTTTIQYTPVQVGTATNWASVACGTNYGLAVRQDGTLWAWGNNGFGQLGLGNNSTTNQYAPTQVGTATSWQSVSAGYAHALAVKTDGTLWSWGYNYYGQLGLGSGSSITQYAPVQIGTATNWQSVSAANYSSAALRQDGTLYTWGYNYFAQLGQGNTTLVQPLPTAVGTARWQQVAVGSYGHMLGIQQNPASLWGWGFNQYGQLGQAYYQAQPTYIPNGGALLAAAAPAAPAAWTLAPNPAHAYAQLLGLPAGPVQVHLFDSQGRLVRTATVPTVPTADLAPGLYLVRATAGPTTRTLRLAVE